MYGELERCPRCHGRFPAAFGHACPRETTPTRGTEEFEAGFGAWLRTKHGQFAEYLARRERGAEPSAA
ncbi:MAG TPA: hypothetical protein VFR63_00480 [Gaiellaceae bacterium]|jgi:hypothetical protein|nr:hypothetical protein [Gaiellaceae bacterium]